mgnify:FL=1
MTLPISDQIVLVTGAGRGLGAAIAKAFAREGAHVIVNYRKSQAQAERLAEELGDRARAMQADVRNLSALHTLAKDLEGSAPTTIVHNALADYSFNGDGRDTIFSLQANALHAQLETAVAGALNLMQVFGPSMQAEGFGRVVTIGSNLVQNPVVPYHDYTAAKSALLALTRTAAAELGPHGVTDNMVSGGL